MSCPQKTGTARGGSRSLRFACGFLWGLFCSIRRLTAIVSHASVFPAVAYTKGRYTLGAVGQENAAVTTLDLTAQSGSLGCRLGCCLPVADVQHRPTRQRRPSAERCPPGTSAPASFLSRKLGKELHPSPPRMCASLLMSTSEASCPRRDLPGVQPPRTCASLLMSTSGASCHRRELTAEALRRGRALTVRKGAAFSRRPKARIAPGGLPG